MYGANRETTTFHEIQQNTNTNTHRDRPIEWHKLMRSAFYLSPDEREKKILYDNNAVNLIPT